MTQIRCVGLTIILMALSCAQSYFSGSATSKANGGDRTKASDLPNVDDKVNSQNAADGKDVGAKDAGGDGNKGGTTTDGSGSGDPGTSGDQAPTDLAAYSDGSVVVKVNYETCASLPASGKRGYGKCNDGEVVVIVNDGKAQEMTCCPVTGKNILTKIDAEKFVERTGTCQANEVLTGMKEPQTPTIFCSKINDKFLTLSTPTPSLYVNGNASGIMGQIAASYNVSDTCICPEGLVAVGGHTAKDNKCAEQCVTIEKKK